MGRIWNFHTLLENWTRSLRGTSRRKGEEVNRRSQLRLKAMDTLLLTFSMFLFFLANTEAKCPDLPLQFFATVICTKGTEFGSECKVQCNEGYSLIPETYGEYILKCKENGAWDKEVPYCHRSCPPNAKADIVFVIDSSTSMRGVTKTIMKQFLLELISRWTVSVNNINVAIVPYNGEVLKDRVVKLTSSSYDNEGLIEAINDLPNNSPGSLTGKALTFALDEVLSPSNGNRPSAPDIVIVLTDGRGQDKVDPPLTRLWSAGVTTFAVGFPPRRRMPIITRQLIKICQNVTSRMHLAKRKAIGSIDTMMYSLRQIYCPPTAICNPLFFYTFRNGIMNCTKRVGIGSSCTFHCNQRFSLEGPRNIKCIPQGIGGVWSADPPRCAPTCNSLIFSGFQNGNINCSERVRIGDGCRFQCNKEYTLEGPEFVECRSKGVGAVWSEDPPECAPTCDPLELTRLGNGKANCTGNVRIGDSCSFQCDAGFSLSGPEYITCFAKGIGAAWSAATPKCEPTCDSATLSTFSNGRTSCTGRIQVGDSCSFKCNEGFSLIGAEFIECTSGRTGTVWSDDPPQCAPTCDSAAFSSFSNGITNCTGKVRIGISCLFRCNEAFTMDGSEHVTCIRNKERAIWSDSIPACSSTCNILSFSNGKTNCSGRVRVGTSCSFRCDRRFLLNGPENVNCVGRGVGAAWSEDPPTCAPSCDARGFGRFDNGNANCSGRVRLGSSCLFQCNERFSLVGAETIKCILEGTTTVWSDNPPNCAATCDSLGFVGFENGRTNCSTAIKFGTVCLFQCDEEYALEGPENVECIAGRRGGAWSDDFPKCSPTCTSFLLDVSNGKSNCSGRVRIGTACLFQCNNEYALDGPESVECTAEGTTAVWSGDPPKCAHTCDHLTISTLINGETNCSRRVRIGKTCSFQCNSGFALVGPEYLQCVKRRDNAAWRSDPPTCAPTCDPATFTGLDNGNTNCTGRVLIGDSCAFRCNENFALQGPENIKCISRRSNPRWSENPPVCAPTCDPENINRINNGKTNCSERVQIGNSCSFQCDEEYSLVGIETVKCVSRGGSTIWSDEAPSCAPTCKPLAFRNGNTNCSGRVPLSNSCSFECAEEFSLLGPKTIECIAAGSTAVWSDDPPKCDPTCDHLAFSRFRNGETTCSGRVRIGDSCSFQCSEGFTLIGPKDVQCISEGNEAVWSKDRPRCAPTCAPLSLSDFEHGTTNCSAGRMSVGTSCSFQCNDKFVLIGPERIRCVPRRRRPAWSEAPPTCAPTCDSLSLDEFPNGVTNCTGRVQRGMTCSFECNRRFILDGPEYVECIGQGSEAIWSRGPPNCSPTCKALTFSKLGDGVSNCTGRVSLGQSCSFQCNEGLSLKGPENIQCVERGNEVDWSEDPPTCTRTCDPESFDRLVNGKTNCSETVRLGASCSFQCDENYILVGPENIQCVIRARKATWSDNSPTCEPTCESVDFNGIETGGTNCSGRVRIGIACSFECAKRFILDGPDRIECIKDRTGAMWSSDPPKCAATCKALTFNKLGNGNTNCTGRIRIGRSCAFQCSDGFSRIGPQYITCVTNGNGAVWSEDPPTCTSTCSAELLSRFRNGESSCSGVVGVGTSCTFRCNENYSLFGPENIRCITRGRRTIWSEDPPTCTPTCIAYSIGNGETNCTGRVRLGNICSFECPKRFFLDGSKNIACISNGAEAKWSHDRPKCSPTCKPLTFNRLGNGKTNCTGRIPAGTFCSFDCNEEFALEGPEYITCVGAGDEEAVWTQDPPTCEPTCTELTSNGVGNLRGNCTGRVRIGTSCSFGCSKGFALSGVEVANCISRGNRAAWSEDPPTCSPVCDPSTFSPFANGSTNCRKNVKVGRTCSFQCDKDFGLVGPRSIRCTARGKRAIWSADPPKCAPTCDPSVFDDIRNGGSECTESVPVGSSCAFRCNRGFALEGPRSAECVQQDTGATWSGDTATCAPTCNHLVLNNGITNGNSNCTRRVRIGSSCSFQCDGRFALVGPEYVTCLASTINRAIWSDDPPICAPTCIPLLLNDFGGISTNCSGRIAIGGSCSLKCGEEFALVGPELVTCRSGRRRAVWSEDPPGCAPTCDSFEFSAFTNGQTNCTDRVRIGNSCSFQCNRGFALEGLKSVKCISQRTDAVWSGDHPICYPICEPLNFSAFGNGTINCTDGLRIGDRCSFTCKEGFSLVGPPVIECLAEGARANWSDETPICAPLDACKPPRDSISNGEATCTNTNRVGSVCTYKCTTPDYILYPSNSSSSACLSNNKWSRQKPCCALPCPPYAKMDAVIILDSSSSIGQQNWVIMKSFIRSILGRFTVSDEFTNFAVVRYNRIVDVENQILLRDYPRDRQDLIRAFNRIPYGGSGTLTGAAIQHVVDNLLTPDAGNRPDFADVVIVITDGKASDDVRTPSNRLRETGATILVIGIVPSRGGLDLFQLREIAGSEENLFIVEGGFEDLDASFAQQISDKACGNPCERA